MLKRHAPSSKQEPSDIPFRPRAKTAPPLPGPEPWFTGEDYPKRLRRQGAVVGRHDDELDDVIDDDIISASYDDESDDEIVYLGERPGVAIADADIQEEGDDEPVEPAPVGRGRGGMISRIFNFVN